MERDARSQALDALLKKADRQGFVTFDDIMNSGDEYALSIADFDWVSNTITTRGILVYDTAPTTSVEEIDDDEVDDYSQIDYEKVYREIIRIEPSLEPFVEEVRAIRPPQFRETSQLKYLVQEGNAHARQRMVEMHLRIALRIGLQRAQTYNTDIVDSVLNACLGVVSAVDRYDPDTSGPFASYASIWALQFVSRLQPTQNPHIYFPVHRQESYYAIYPVLKSHGCLECSDLAYCPHASEMICDKIGCRPEEIDDLIMALQPPASYEEYLEEVLRDDPAGEFFCDNHPWAEYVPELDMFDSVANSEVKRMIKEALEKLTPKEEEIVVARFGLDGGRPKTLEEIGQIRGITRERVRQIEKKALRKLIHPARSRALRDLVEPGKREKAKKVKTPRKSS